MEKQIANYTIVIEKQKRIGTEKACYAVYVPILGIATEADTLEQVEKDIQSLIQFHLDCLADEDETIPIETESTLITRSSVTIPKRANISS